MSGKCYPEAFKIKVVKQVIERGHSVSSVATRLDITIHSLYAWIKPPHSRRHHVDLNLTGHTGSSGWNRAVFMVIARSVSICWISGTMRCKQSLGLMQRVEIKAQVGYRSPRARGDSFY